MRRPFVLAVLVACLPLLLACLAEKSAERASVRLEPLEAQSQMDGCVVAGVVREPSGAPIPGASVSVVADGMHGTRRAETDREGRFRLFLPPTGGPFRLRAEAYGHSPATLEEFACPEGQRLPLVITLPPEEESLPLGGSSVHPR